MANLQLHDDGVTREVDEACRHRYVNVGWPWVGPAPPHCALCGVWWPGHELVKPYRIRGDKGPDESSLPDWQTMERDDVRVRQPLTRRRPYTARWSNVG